MALASGIFCRLARLVPKWASLGWELCVCLPTWVARAYLTHRLRCQVAATGTSPNVVSGTGVSTAGRTEWQVIAHEIGHNFGAIVRYIPFLSLRRSIDHR